MEAEEGARLLKAAQSKRHATRLGKQPSSLALRCEMHHPCQLESLSWLIKLHSHGISSALADEMGLDKVLQTVSLLACVHKDCGAKGPHLVVAPSKEVRFFVRSL